MVICWLFNVGTERGIGMIWKQQPFIERLIEIGDRASIEFDSIYYNIDVVLPVLCRCKPTHARQKAIMVILKTNLKQVAVIQNYWKTNKNIIAQGLRDIYIENPQVVSKSYPQYWDHLKEVGFDVEEIV